jgi:hypothetical protein
MIAPIHRYPRTPHLAGSRLQPGDHDLSQVPLEALRGAFCDDDGRVRLQSRGHVLVGGAREKHWDLFKQWAHTHEAAIAARVPPGGTIYGEWLYAKHTVFYDALPHYFLEFDVRDAAGAFWSTARRSAHLAGSPIAQVPVLWQGVVRDPARLPALVARSRYKTARWRDELREAAAAAHVDGDRAALETDPTDLAEGLYVKVEDAGTVIARYKWIRASFLTAVVDSGSHWLNRPIVANRLAPGVDLFAGRA